MGEKKSLFNLVIVCAFAHPLYLFICSVKMDLGLVDVQGLFIVSHRQICKGAIFPVPYYKLVASVCAMGFIEPETLAIYCEREGIHEVQQLRRK